MPIRERASTGSTQMDLSPAPNWTLDEYRRKCAALVDMNYFDAIAVGGKNLVVYDRSRFERETAQGRGKDDGVLS